MKPARVFADTNIILSGLLYPAGNEASLLELAVIGRIRLVLAEAVLTEVRRVIHNKFAEHAGEFDDYLARVSCDLVALPDDAEIESAARLVRDPKDAPILASILLSKPDFAITGDKDLLTDEVKAIAPVCTCAEYLQKLIAES